MNKPTQEEIALLKKEHGKLYLIEVEGNTPCSFLIKEPSIKILTVVSIAKTPMDGMALLLKNTIVWGDQSLLEDVRIFMAVVKQANTLTAEIEGTIKNL
jgi:hypothetical protein